MPKKRWRRVLLKLSGEALKGSEKFGISQQACLDIAESLKEAQNHGYQIGIVLGAGNIFRGIQNNTLGLSQTSADHIGMLGTIMNGIALQQTLNNIQCPAHVMSNLDCPRVVESFTLNRATQYLEKGAIVIFAGGTGNPYFTTDTAAALKATEIQADVLLKATRVNGVYDKGPEKFPNAKFYPQISYSQALKENLRVMDQTAFALCRENNMEILVFNYKKYKILDALESKTEGTIVTQKS